jgi:hypothetical protein
MSNLAAEGRETFLSAAPCSAQAVQHIRSRKDAAISETATVAMSFSLVLEHKAFGAVAITKNREMVF